MRSTVLHIFIPVFLVSCLCVKTVEAAKPNDDKKVDIAIFFDQSRDRIIPVAFYRPDTGNSNQQVVIFSHGYGQNQGGDYLVYSYLTKYLATKGYFVVSIQHELSTDELLAMEDDLQVTRRPNWERGSENILFVLNELKSIEPGLDYGHVTLIGHSNGGDMSVLFAHEYPELVDKVISMDNRRMPLPRVASPRIYTLRSNDYGADEEVLPTDEEQQTYGITVQFVPINHGQMDDDATVEERKIMTGYIEKYLSE